MCNVMGPRCSFSISEGTQSASYRLSVAPPIQSVHNGSIISWRCSETTKVFSPLGEAQEQHSVPLVRGVFG
jgi:hypothetical protein